MIYNQKLLKKSAKLKERKKLKASFSLDSCDFFEIIHCNEGAFKQNDNDYQLGHTFDYQKFINLRLKYLPQ